MEAEYALDDRSPLDFYNCLVPKLKEHRRFSLKNDQKLSIADFRAQQEVYKLKLKLEKEKLPRMESEYALMREKNEMLENEL